ncbi:MAG: hypothetical protein FI700_00015 [SAR202 cluster bacterium]|nr:hypothetical protein [SAR202 cluster bacterium]
MKHHLLTTIAAVVLVGCGPSVDIWTGAQTGNIEAVKQHLADGVDVNSKSDIGRTPLDVAIAFKQPLITDLLRKHGGKTRDELKAAESIVVAVQLGNIEAVKQHLNDGTEVNAKSGTGRTPLHLAAFKDYKEIVKLLIESGADVNAKDMDDATPLDYAMSEGEKETAELLRKHGGKHGTIHSAVGGGDVEAVKEFLVAGADVNVKAQFGETLLHAAVSNNHKEIAELLIKEGADVNAVAMDDVFSEKTPLDAANKHNQGAVAVLLRKHGGKTREELEAPIDAAKKGDIETVKQHLAAGADVNYRNKNGDTLLNYAAFLGHKEIVELLLENGADMNAKGLADWTPLHLAAQNKQEQIVQLLIANGAEVNPYTSPGFGGTPLDVADGKIADLIRKHGGKTGEELKAEGK